MSAKHALLSSNLNGVFDHGPSVQLGVDAALSRQRSPVQIRYGSLSQFGIGNSELGTT